MGHTDMSFKFIVISKCIVLVRAVRMIATPLKRSDLKKPTKGWPI
jgi:hypothetical protein